MTRLTTKQRELIAELELLAEERTEAEDRGVCRHLGNTHQIAHALGHYQAYESHLRDRLFRLADRGVLQYAEIGKGPNGFRERIWFFT